MPKAPKQIPFSVFFSILAWSLACFFSVFYSVIGVFIGLPWTILFEKSSGAVMHSIARLWAQSIVAGAVAWKVVKSGEPFIDSSKTYVIISNHQSILDILAVLAALPLHFKFVAKKELFAIPFAGWHMALTGYIAIDRKDAKSRQKTLLKSLEWLKKKVSVLFFPEGTRSLNGEIQNFKPGAFRAAQELGLEILPVVVHGTGDAIPKKSFLIHKVSKFQVSIGKPVRIGPEDPLDAAIKNIREEMKARLEVLKKNENSYA